MGTAGAGVVLVPVGRRGSKHLCPTPRWGWGGSAVPLGGSLLPRVLGRGRERGRPTDPLPSPSEEPVEPQAEAKVRLDFVPRQSGLRKLVVDFESDKLTGVKGHRNVIIAPQPK